VNPLGRELFEMDQDVAVMQPTIALKGQKPMAGELGTQPTMHGVPALGAGPDLALGATGVDIVGL
jgi:hypothetical protein